MTASKQESKLVSVDELGPSGVTVVKGTSHGDLAVGMSNGAPFAISNRCRHLFGPLGKGNMDAAGHLVCPWHHAEYDVRTGQMTLGPQGAFKPIAGPVKATLGSMNLKTYDVELRDGAIYLKD
jgi:nitrite reductase/ring-hydroxylating ferredoxin subunit